LSRVRVQHFNLCRQLQNSLCVKTHFSHQQLIIEALLSDNPGHIQEITHDVAAKTSGRLPVIISTTTRYYANLLNQKRLYNNFTHNKIRDMKTKIISN
jgi:hypothetical protein